MTKCLCHIAGEGPGYQRLCGLLQPAADATGNGNGVGASEETPQLPLIRHAPGFGKYVQVRGDRTQHLYMRAEHAALAGFFYVHVCFAPAV